MTSAEAYAAALACLPQCGPRRLAALLGDGIEPASAWERSTSGDVPGVPRAIASLWRTPVLQPSDALAAHAAAGISVHVRGRGDYPARLADDHEAPPVLFSSGCLEHLLRPTVAIVGTRRCTHYGREVAAELGRSLAEAGVAVVSGLALGIDGAAHEGALAAGAGAGPPVGVVGSGLDVVYPPRHRTLWARVAGAGLLLSEAPMGSPPEAWRFPLRNRIIAALAQVVVVVESHAAGGSMHTVQAAQDRDRTVMAVPGSVRSRSSEGTNRLLAEGAIPVVDVDDVLVALSLAPRPAPADPDPRLDVEVEGLDAEARSVLQAVDHTPTSADDVVRRSGVPPQRLAPVLVRLEVAGLVRSTGGWWERCS